MKPFLTVLIVAGLTACSGCRSEHALSWRTEGGPQKPFVTDSDYVEISYPFAVGGPAADSINRQIAEQLKSAFAPEGTGCAGMTVAGTADSIIARKNRDTATRRMPYDLRAAGRVSRCGDIASVHLTTYRMTGGAHGVANDYVLNFDVRSGARLGLTDWVSDTARFREINRQAFAKFMLDAGLSEEALFVRADDVPLPDNIRIDSSGLTMHYNPYEIAPYVFGSTEYLIPYDRIESVLRRIARK